MQTVNIKVYGKDMCPFCTKAVDDLKAAGLVHEYIKVTDPSELPNPLHRTVPQIVIDGGFIGGYTDLVPWLRNYKARQEASAIVESRNQQNDQPHKITFFNENNKGHITGKYPLFLGDELGFADNIHQPYPVLEELYDQQMAQIWGHTEVDLTQDRIDMGSIDRNITELMIENLIWQTLLDGVAARAIGATLGKHVTNQSLQDLYNAIILFESIHSKTYLHIIRQCFDNPAEVLKRGYSNLAAIKRSQHLLNAFNNLANHSGTEQELRKLIMFCVAALYMMEAINFQSSFAVTFAIAERGYYQGISQNIVLIARDEMLHAEVGAKVFSLLIAEWPETYAEIKPMLQKMLESVVEDEEAWTKHIFSNGRYVLGLSEQLLMSYVEFNAMAVAARVGCGFTPKYLKSPTLPLKYMEKYLDSSKVQVAAQELQVTSYLLNSVKMSSESDIDKTLEALRESYV